jgi:hypothetical protein
MVVELCVLVGPKRKPLVPHIMGLSHIIELQATTAQRREVLRGIIPE